MSEWGEATLTQTDAGGLCLRATLALLARLEAAGLAEDVDLWRLSWAIEGAGRGPKDSGVHWVLIRDEEVIDVSARQFDAESDHIRRAPKHDEFDRSRIHDEIDPDSGEMWHDGGAPNHEIPPWWRELVNVPPPGDLREWPYPRGDLEPTSRWYESPNP